jgi:indolepyruvate ferredoxin oxidoreductase beta subunit
MTERAAQPICLLIAALGGEGGGVLSTWLVWAAAAEGYPVQSTSIPGVAQRTGATTYYIEFLPVPIAELDDRSPIFALTPIIGGVDVMVASELLEAGRAMQNGFVTPDRTTLIASTHRIYSVAEKSAMSDGRYEPERVHRAASELAQARVMFDMSAAANEAGSVINAVLLGAIAGTGRLPIRRDTYEAAIRESGIAVEANLAGFGAGFAAATGAAQLGAPAEPEVPAAPLPASIADRIARSLPEPAHELIEAGALRLLDFQDERYANLFLEHLESIYGTDRQSGGEAQGCRLTGECARYLALWMSYEDVIRVADLKTRSERYERVRAEVGAKPDEPVVITEFLKPGVDEFTSIMPRFVAGPITALARATGLERKLNIGLHIKSTSVTGFAMLTLLAGMKRWRRRTSRYKTEHAGIARWLAAIDRATRRDYRLGLEVIECARLIKGYGDTHKRGSGNFAIIMERLVAPALEASNPAEWADKIAAARQAALADPEGASLDAALATASGLPPDGAAQQAAAE